MGGVEAPMLGSSSWGVVQLAGRPSRKTRCTILRVRLIRPGVVELDKGELIPVVCAVCGCTFKPDTAPPFECPFCGYSNEMEEVPTFEPVDD